MDTVTLQVGDNHREAAVDYTAVDEGGVGKAKSIINGAAIVQTAFCIAPGDSREPIGAAEDTTIGIHAKILSAAIETERDIERLFSRDVLPSARQCLLRYFRDPQVDVFIRIFLPEPLGRFVGCIVAGSANNNAEIWQKHIAGLD